MLNCRTAGFEIGWVPALLLALGVVFLVAGAVLLDDLVHASGVVERLDAQAEARYRESQTPEAIAARKQPKELSADASPY